MTGPRSEPPMPMLTTLRIRLPVYPRHCPSAQFARRNRPFDRVPHVLSGTTSMPLTTYSSPPLGARKAICSAGRSSVRIDWFSPEHCCYALPQLALLGKPQQAAQRFFGDPVFRIVQVNSGGFALRSAHRGWGPRRKLPQMHVLDRLIVVFKCFPSGTSVRRPRNGKGHGAGLISYSFFSS